MASENELKAKRQLYHQLLLALGETKFKEIIVSAQFGVEHTTELNEKQLDTLIADAQKRLNEKRKSQPKTPDKKLEDMLKRLRNKCLLVLAERGIKATVKDWQPVNNELAKKQYQWVVPEELRAQGFVNQKGLYAFRTAAELKKLFNQLVAIRDAEKERADRERTLALKN